MCAVRAKILRVLFWGGGRSPELVGGTRQRSVPEFLALLVLGSPIGHLQPLCTLLCHQSRAPALQKPTGEWAATQPVQDGYILALGTLGGWQMGDWVSKQQEQAPAYSSSIPALPQAVGMPRVRLPMSPALELELGCPRCTKPRPERWKIGPSPCSADPTQDRPVLCSFLSGPFLSFAVDNCLLERE